jgi:hypothetical protein
MYLIKKILARFELDLNTIQHYHHIYEYELLAQRREKERMLKLRLKAE